MSEEERLAIYEIREIREANNPFIASCAMPAGIVPDALLPESKFPCDTKVDNASY
jgi:hypothetical protein